MSHIGILNKKKWCQRFIAPDSGKLFKQKRPKWLWKLLPWLIWRWQCAILVALFCQDARCFVQGQRLCPCLFKSCLRLSPLCSHKLLLLSGQQHSFPPTTGVIHPPHKTPLALCVTVSIANGELWWQMEYDTCKVSSVPATLSPAVSACSP